MAKNDFGYDPEASATISSRELLEMASRLSAMTLQQAADLVRALPDETPSAKIADMLDHSATLLSSMNAEALEIIANVAEPEE